MSKEFDPDEFLEKTAPIAEMQTQQAPIQAQAAPQPGAVPGQGPVAPGMLEQAGNFMTQTAIPTAYGLGAAGASMAAEHPGIAAAAGAAAFPKVASKIPGVGQAMDVAKGVVDMAKNYNLNQLEHQAIQYMKAGQTPPPEFQARLDSLRQAAMPKTPPPGTTGPGILQRGMDIASKMRNFAAQRVVPMAAGAAVPTAVAGAVAAPGAAMMMDAYKNYQTQTPEQRRQSAMEALSGQGLGQAGIY